MTSVGLVQTVSDFLTAVYGSVLLKFVMFKSGLGCYVLLTYDLEHSTYIMYTSSYLSLYTVWDYPQKQLYQQYTEIMTRYW